MLASYSIPSTQNSNFWDNLPEHGPYNIFRAHFQSGKYIPALNIMSVWLQGRSENSHYFGLFNIILSQISPEIISIIRDASQLSGILTKPSRIRFFFEKWLFLVKLHPIKKISCYLLIWPEVRKWSIFELHCDRLPHIESSNGIDVY